jgi:hypothetical protein
MVWHRESNGGKYQKGGVLMKKQAHQTTELTPTDRALIMVKWITVGTVIIFSGLLLLAFLA